MANGEPGTAVKAPEEPTENIETVSLPAFEAAKNDPLGLKATERAAVSGLGAAMGLSAPEESTENISVPTAKSPPFGLNAPYPSLNAGIERGELGAGEKAGGLARAECGAISKNTAIASHKPKR